MIRGEKMILVAASGLLMAVHLFLAAPAVTQYSPTYDEPVHLTAGVVYWKTGDYRYNGYHHPPFGEMWAAIPVMFLNSILPIHHPAWIRQEWKPLDQYRFADTYLYRNRVTPERMMALGRWMQLALSCALGAAVIAAAAGLGGFWAALFAGLFWAFSPAFLANGALVSTDLSFTVFFFGFFACLSRLGRRPFDILAGVCLGLAFASKYFALAMLPLTAVSLVLDPSLRKNGKSWLIVSGIGALCLGAVYRFSNLDVFWSGLTAIFSRSQAGRSSFFAGQHGTQGWILYFPTLLVLKTPLPLLVAVGAAVVEAVRRRLRVPPQFWVPPLVFFLLACVSKVQIGHRHILLVYPFLFVLAGLALNSLFEKKRWLSAPLFVWLAAQTALSRPHHLSYFNEIIGGPTQGYKYFTDSNVDWGQGLKLLAEGLTEEDKSRGIYLSYFGVADPHHHGIRYLDIGSDRIVEREDNSADGLSPVKLAISVTNLQSTYYPDRAAFAWVKQYTPVQTFAHSIFIYDFSNHPEALEQLRRMRS